jgi:alkylation response protein AidB-like acyl-CoA dehydrogenase
VGEENRGWYQIVSQLAYERAGMERLMSNYPLYDALIKHVKKLIRDDDIPAAQQSVIKNKITQLIIEFEIGRLHICRVACLLDSGYVPNAEAAMAKAYCTSFTQRVANTAMEILGQYGQLKADSRRTILEGMAAQAYLFSPSHTIAAGTNEILKNIVAIRGLGLPTE